MRGQGPQLAQRARQHPVPELWDKLTLCLPCCAPAVPPVCCREGGSELQSSGVWQSHSGLFPLGQEGAWDPPDLSHAVLSRLELWETFPADSQVVPRCTGLIRLFPQASSTQPCSLLGQVFAQPCLAAPRDGEMGVWLGTANALLLRVFLPTDKFSPFPSSPWAGRGAVCSPLVWGQLLPLVFLFPRLN